MSSPRTSVAGYGEFVALTALIISLVALSIDAMLPALREIGEDLGAGSGNQRQWIITTLFLGMAFAQIAYGPLSDSYGRKPVIYAGFAFFILGCLISAFSTTYSWMLAGRFLQGVGAAGPRIVAIAIVRDRYQGNSMAKIMSLIMAVFIMVPALAPAVGQAVLLVSNWRAIFGLFLVLSTVALVWFWARQPETLAPERRIPFSIRNMAGATCEIFTHRAVIGYIIAAGFIFGAFVGYLSSSQQILQEQYGLGELFPLYFGVLALAIGCASVVNSKLVMRHGMRLLSRRASQAVSVLSIVYLIIALLNLGHPPLWSLMAYLLAAFFSLGMLFGNFNALAMEPLGHIAGIAAAVIGSVTTFLSLLLGAIIGGVYDGSVIPLVTGFALLGIGAYLAIIWAERPVLRRVANKNRMHF